MNDVSELPNDAYRKLRPFILLTHLYFSIPALIRFDQCLPTKSQ